MPSSLVPQLRRYFCSRYVSKILYDILHFLAVVMRGSRAQESTKDLESAFLEINAASTINGQCYPSNKTA